ncbi:MAG TPA: hypothetical protein VMP01_16695 [Pirellulaceae bacterium]|nr:hypothetical protein [Pirellulaceae bacterium]
MACYHLRDVEQALLASGIRETFRGAAWSHNCREWVYFDCYLDLSELRQRFPLADCVVDHEGIVGFYGASSMERLPVEPTIRDRVREFAGLQFKH